MINRRRAVSLIAGCAVTGSEAGAQAVARAQTEAEPYGDSSAADKWMLTWMNKRKRDFKERNPGMSEKAAAGSLFVGRFADRMYYTASTIGWTPTAPAEVANYPAIRVPVGFVTDFASIPRVLWSVLPPDGQYAYAAVVHDYLYWEQYLSREKSDDILKFLMADFKVPSEQAWAVYNGVRLGGQFAWDGNAKLKASGERRLLRTIPDDPTILWSDWKRRPDAF